MGEKLINKVATGVAWSTAEKLCSMLLQMAVSIIVARLLSPEDFGVIAILTFFTAVSATIIDGGFSQILLRKEATTTSDYKSVFLFNIAAAVLLYLLFVAISPLLASYYNLDVITEIAPILFLVLPISALGVIQNTILARDFQFALLSRINLLSSLISGAIAILVATLGGGVWALVAQRVSVVAVKSCALWIRGIWRCEGAASFSAWREMAPFSFRLMSTDIVSAVYNNVAQLFIGKMYSANTLGYFNQAQKIKDLPVQSAVLSVQGVTYPALARIKDDSRKFEDSYRKVLMISAYLMTPAMVGMSAVAEPLFKVLLGEKWLPTIPYFEIIALCGIFYPLAMLAYNVLKVYSDGGIIFRLEIIKRVVMTIILAITIPHSVMAIAYGLLAMSAIEFIINFAATRRYTSLKWLSMVGAIAPSFILSTVMWVALYCIKPYMLDLHPFIQLISQIGIGVAIYCLGSLICRLSAFNELIGVVKGVFRRD